MAALVRELARRDARGWVVGGAARDLILGLEVPDVDVAVESDPFELARSLEAAGAGTFVPLSNESPRVARLAGRRELDIAAVEGGSIERDLARRDFAANAIAIPLARRRGGTPWIDPFGGIADLAKRRLRIISEGNLRDDPLRAWRAARLFATRSLTPDRATTAASRRVAPLLSSAAPERIRSELEKLLAAPCVSPALGWAASADLLGEALGIRLTRRRAISVANGPFDASGLAGRPPEDRVPLRLALLAARCGMGAREALEWLAARRFPRATARRVSKLLELAARAASPGVARSAWAWVRDAGDQAAAAIVLAYLLFPRARPAIAAHARAARSARRPPRVTGRDVLAWTGGKPGPEVGSWLAELEIEGLRGAISTRAAARRWLHSRSRERPGPVEGKGPGSGRTRRPRAGL